MHGLIEWAQGIQPHLAIVILTLAPILELRASIPFGLLATELPVWQVWLTAVLSNWIIAPLIYLVLKRFLKLMMRWQWFEKCWERYTEGLQKRIHKAVETWGSFGLAIFIGIPIPGSGVYAGSIGAYLLGMSMRRFMVVSLAGVMIAATVITVIIVSGSEAFNWMINQQALKDGQ